MPEEVKPYLDPRLPSPAKVAKILGRTGKSVAEAREFNRQVSAEDQREFYEAGLKKIAAKFWDLAAQFRPNENALMIYARVLHDHFEQKIKETKNEVALRHLKLIETKTKALEELAKDRTLPTAEVFAKARDIFFPASNGHNATQDRAPKLIENGFTS